MNIFLKLFLVILAALGAGIGDALTKKAAFKTDNFLAILKDPLVIVIILLYLVQTIIFAYLFTKKVELGVVGVLQIVFYSFVVLVIGALFFNESLRTIQWVGIVVSIIGVVLINL